MIEHIINQHQLIISANEQLTYYDALVKCITADH